MIEVYINNERLELEEQNITQTFQVNDIGDPKSRQTGYTNKFKVIKTPKNVKIFENLGLVGKQYNTNSNSKKFPYGTTNAKIFQDGIEILKNGYATVFDVKKHYNIAIYGNEKSFFDKLKQYTLVDAMAHEYPNGLDIAFNGLSYADYVNKDDVFCIPVINHNDYTSYFNNGDGTHSIRYGSGNINPLFYVKDLFEYMFNLVGYSVEHNLNVDSYFNSLFISATKLAPDIAYDESYNIVPYTPEILLSDFLTEIMIMFGLIITVDENAKKVSLLNIDDLLNNVADDWSEKYSETKSQSWRLKSVKNSIFKYDEDDEDILTGVLDIGKENSSTRTSIFKKPIKVVPRDGGDKITDFYTYFNGKPMLLYKTVINSPARFYIQAGFTKDKFYMATFQETNYQNAIDNYYSKWKKLLEKIHVVNAFLNLNIIDIYNLDFKKPKYIKQLGAKFYLNKVKNYKQGKLTEVELIKIPI